MGSRYLEMGYVVFGSKFYDFDEVVVEIVAETQELRDSHKHSQKK